MALRIPLERAKPGGTGAAGEEEALVFIPHHALCSVPLTQVNWSCTPLPLCSALTHTPNKHLSAHVQERNQNSVSPDVRGAQGPSVHLGQSLS